MNHRTLGGLPGWLPLEVACGIARTAQSALATRGGEEEARAAVRAAAAACLPSLPAPMLAEVAAAVVPAEPPSEHASPNVVPTDAERLARRLALLAGGSTDFPLGAAAAAERVAARLASAGTARISGDSGPTIAD